MIRIVVIVSCFTLVACTPRDKEQKAGAPGAAGASATGGPVVSGPPANAALPAANFVLSCNPLDTADSGTIVCFRMDTRTGEMARIRQDRLPQSAGSGKAAAQSAGTYQLECASSTTDKKANMSCVRLNRVTGDMMLVTLPKLPEFPDK